jgi:hypothetical protein
MLARHLTPENQAAVLAAAAHKGKQEVEELLERLCPRPDVAASVRKVPVIVPPVPRELPAADPGRLQAGSTPSRSGAAGPPAPRPVGVVVADLERKKFAATPHPRPPREAKVATGTIPAEVRRSVRARDQQRCAFVSRGGHRCGATRLLEFHHVVPRACGGPATVENIQLRCRTHNGHEVDLFFGPGMRYTREASRGRHGWVGSDSDARGRSGTSP